VSSRQQEKERRRQERLEAERRAAAEDQRKQRLRIIGASVVLVLVLVGVGVALATSGGGGGGSGSPKGKSDAAKVPIPARKVTDLNQAVKAAGCTLKSYPKGYEDRGHVPTSTKLVYKTNPPSFGKHFEVPASDGDYVGVATPAPGHLVHALEHGRIQYQYAPSLPKKQQQGLETLFNEDPDLVMVFKNTTGMPYRVAAVAWTHVLGCKTFTPGVYDAFRAFREKYRLKAPEVIAQPE
jgi:hypothetical protein